MKIENQTSHNDAKIAWRALVNAKDELWFLWHDILSKKITPENASKKLAEILEPLQIEK